MEQQNQKPKWVIPVIAILAVLLVGCIVAICYLQISERKEASQPQVTFTAAPTKSPEEETLEKGKKLFEQGDYVTAISTLKSLGMNSDASVILSKCYFEYGKKLRSEGKYEEAVGILKQSSETDAQKEIEYCEDQILEKSDYLEVKYVVNQSEREEKGNYYKNGEGKLKFATDLALDPWCGDGTYITYCQPMSKIHFKLENTGNKTLKNVTLILSFDGLVLKENPDNSNFTYQNHCNGIGGWGGAIATLGNLQSGLCFDTTFSVQEAYSFNGADGGNLSITVSADNYKARTYKVPIKLDV